MHKILSRLKKIDRWLDKKLDGNELGFGDLMYEQASKKKAEKDMSLKQSLIFLLIYVIFVVVVLIAQSMYGFTIDLPL